MLLKNEMFLMLPAGPLGGGILHALSPSTSSTVSFAKWPCCDYQIALQTLAFIPIDELVLPVTVEMNNWPK